jgi:hypothetical protein
MADALMPACCLLAGILAALRIFGRWSLMPDPQGGPGCMSGQMGLYIDSTCQINYQSRGEAT